MAYLKSLRSRALCGALLAGAAIVPAAIAAAPAHADPDSLVSIETATSFASGTGTFTVQGSGLCPSGTTSEPDGVVVEEHGRLLTFELDKLFTCANGSGTFTIRIRAWYRPCAPTNRGVWTVIGGTREYAEMTGHGQLVGTYVPGPCDDAEAVVDSYRGHIRR